MGPRGLSADLHWIHAAGGRAADLSGRRRIFLFGVALFGLASLICGLAHSEWMLILARGGQGIGAALTMPAAMSIITTTFPEGPQRNKALSIFIDTGGAGFACGLALGGVLTTFFIFHSSTLGATCGVAFLVGAFFSFLFVSTLYLQNVLHSSPLDASLTLLPAAIISIPVSQFVAPWLMNWLDTKFTLGLGLLGVLGGIMHFLRTGESDLDPLSWNIETRVYYS